ncbi:MAG: glycosyl hydrolase family 5 [Alphaproteobacteria bacterium]|nr:glycosyl hydrolase family 5 [Alphaproteobacteria bacterium]
MRERLQSVSRRVLLRNSLVAAGVGTALAGGRAFAQPGVAGRDLSRDKRPILHAGGLKFGAYDPYGDFKNDAGLATEHLFLPWEDVELGALPAADAYAQAHQRNILVTIEPWSWAQDWNTTPVALRDSILSGERDANMRAILNILANFKSPVTIRWAQEMESRFGRFSWSNWKPADYIAAFKRMVGLMREVAPRARVMWSPRGERNLRDYYPGGEFVDLIGLTVFGLEKFDVIEYGAPRTFAASVKQGYELTAGYGKPIWVAELGYAGSLDYVSKWVRDVTMKRPEYPQLKEVVYFDDREVWPWPHHLGRPDWRVVAGNEFLYPLRGRP